MSEIPPHFAAYPRQSDPRQYYGPPDFRLGAINEGWMILKADLGTWAVATFLIAVIGLLVQLPGQIVSLTENFGHLSHPNPPSTLFLTLNAIFGLISTGVSTVLYGGFYRVVLGRMRLRYEGLAGIFNSNGVGRNLFVWGVISSIPSIIGTTVMSVIMSPDRVNPNIDPAGALASLGVLLLAMLVIAFLTFPFVLVPLIIVDKKTPWLEAAKTSWDTVTPVYFRALGVMICTFVVSLVGIVLCGIGILLTAPLVPLTLAVIYRDYFIPPLIAEVPMSRVEGTVPPFDIHGR